MESLLDKWASRERTFERDIEKEILPYVDNRNAVFLFGPRRAGKSTVAMRLLEKMPKSTVTRYVNLEDPELSGELDTALLDEFARGLKRNDVVVFDEVQLVEGWEKWVRRAVDTRQCRVIVTGSSAKLLSSEFASSLGGRGIGFQVLPLSYSEFAGVHGKNLVEYFKLGGYPEVVLNPEKKDKLLESYFELALIKDIIGRHAVRDANALRSLAFLLLTNSGKETSLRKMRSVLGLSYDTIREFVGYLEESFLVFQVPFFSYSLADSLTRPRKVYAWDLGMQQYASKSFSGDSGRLAECAVAIELKRRQNEIYYWKGKREIDFVAKQKNEIKPINVCYSKSLPKREFEGLREFFAEKNINKAQVLYLGKDKQISEEKTEINLANLEKWLLEN